MAENETTEVDSQGDGRDVPLQGADVDQTHQGVAVQPSRKSPAALTVLGFVAALGVGLAIGQWWHHRGDPALELETGPRYRVELRGDEPSLGPADALVTVIEFSDYQCPYCAKADEPLRDAVEDAGDVRLIHKHYPLPGHAKAIPAARVAWAALQQGKFWEFHHWLFDHKAELGELDAEIAQQGLNSERFLADMTGEAAGAAIDGDRLAGGRIGVTGTPVFFVNGHRYVGARSEDDWDTIFADERNHAEQVMTTGVPRSGVFEAVMKDAVAEAKAPRGSGPDPAVVHAVPTDGRPALGPSDALVTVVLFSDFQCPYCRRVADTLGQLVRGHEDIRLVFRNFPMRGHARARGAAKAALAADRQGKFWAMHDALFAAQADLNDADFSEMAEQLGLDVAKFEADVNDPVLEQMIAQDEAIAASLQIRGRPAAFVNGRFVGGAQPLETFDSLAAQGRHAAQALLDQGVARAAIYDTLMESAQAPRAKESK